MNILLAISKYEGYNIYSSLSKQKCCLWSTGVSTENQNLTSVLHLRQDFFSNKKYDSYRCWSCAELCEAFTFLMENIYVQFDGMVYQQIVGIPMGTNCVPLIADLFLYCYERDFMSDLNKSKSHDLIDMFNDTSRYLDDIFTIDNPDFEKYIPDIYPAEHQLNKANTSDKENLIIKLSWLLAVTFIPAFTTNAMTSDFLILRSPKGGCCSISDDLSCSCKFTLVPFAVWSR